MAEGSEKFAILLGNRKKQRRFHKERIQFLQNLFRLEMTESRI